MFAKDSSKMMRRCWMIGVNVGDIEAAKHQRMRLEWRTKNLRGYHQVPTPRRGKKRRLLVTYRRHEREFASVAGCFGCGARISGAEAPARTSVAADCGDLFEVAVPAGRERKGPDRPNPGALKWLWRERRCSAEGLEPLRATMASPRAAADSGELGNSGDAQRGIRCRSITCRARPRGWGSTSSSPSTRG